MLVGDSVRFERAVFTGSYRKPVFAGFELMTGKIVFDSYGSEKQQHTFTLRLDDGKKMLIKGVIFTVTMCGGWLGIMSMIGAPFLLINMLVEIAHGRRVI